MLKKLCYIFFGMLVGFGLSIGVITLIVVPVMFFESDIASYLHLVYFLIAAIFVPLSGYAFNKKLTELFDK